MANVLLPILPGSLPAQYCFTSWPQLLLDISNAQKAVLPGATFFNYGADKPEPQFQTYPWLRTTDMRWYEFVGVWRSPVPYSTLERRIFIGTLTELQTYDGGSATGVVGSPTAGPMWVEDEAFRDRSPIGVGPTIQSTVDEDYGSKQHTLTEAEGAVGAHTHGIGKYLTGATSLAYTGQYTVPTYTGAVVQGISGGSVTGPDTVANLFTLPSGTGALGVPTPSAFNIVHPVHSVYVVKWSGRQYWTVS